jgi:hypothetical protein
MLTRDLFPLKGRRVKMVAKSPTAGMTKNIPFLCEMHLRCLKNRIELVKRKNMQTLSRLVLPATK